MGVRRPEDSLRFKAGGRSSFSNKDPAARGTTPIERVLAWFHITLDGACSVAASLITGMSRTYPLREDRSVQRVQKSPWYRISQTQTVRRRALKRYNLAQRHSHFPVRIPKRPLGLRLPRKSYQKEKVFGLGENQQLNL